MKITKLKTKSSDFKPFSIQIEIESKEELDSLKEMTSFNVSIPDIVVGRRKQIYNFLEDLCNVLKSK